MKGGSLVCGKTSGSKKEKDNQSVAS
eukprot:COSAG06_NODE_53865_length_297_cov_1.343434_1_plen_25_part_01